MLVKLAPVLFWMIRKALIVVVLVGVAAFFINYRVSIEDARLKVAPWGANVEPSNAVAEIPKTFTDAIFGEQEDDASEATPQPAAATLSPVDREDDTIRIATFNLDPFSEVKLNDAKIANVITNQLAAHDIVAIQGVQSRSQKLLVDLIARLNARSKDGSTYSYACPFYVGREPIERYNAFVFNASTVEVDRSTVVEVEDGGLYTIRPLIAAFRTKGPAPTEAFTFTLINVRVDSPSDVRQVDQLAEVYRSVRDDGRGEDDIIMLGRLCDEGENKILNQLALASAVGGHATTIDGTQALDNILFHQRASIEFTGKVGITDLMLIYDDMSFEQALAICRSNPVWAEFSMYEAGRVASSAF